MRTGGRFWRCGPIYGRARSAMPGQGTIDRMRPSSTSTARDVATNIGSSIRLQLPRRFGPGVHAASPSRVARPVTVPPSTPDASARTSGMRTGRVRATSLLCASTCTRGPRFALGLVSSNAILSGCTISKGGWQRGDRVRIASGRATNRRPAFRPPLSPHHTAPEFVRPTDPSCRR